MQPIEEFLSNNQDNFYAWGGLDICCCMIDSDRHSINNESDTSYFDEFLGKHVDQIQEVERKLVERDYHYQQVSVFDYYFTLVGDPENLYVLQTNIRMYKHYDRWHWFCQDYKNRFYKIVKRENIETLFIETYAVHDNGDVFHRYERWAYDDIGKTPYDINEERYEPGEEPYTGLKFGELPIGAIKLKIPWKITQESSTLDTIGYILSYRPDWCFASGK